MSAAREPRLALPNEQPKDNEYVPPIASGFRAVFCDHCPHLHVLLENDRGAGIAQFILSREQASELARRFESKRETLGEE